MDGEPGGRPVRREPSRPRGGGNGRDGQLVSRSRRGSLPSSNATSLQTVITTPDSGRVVWRHRKTLPAQRVDFVGKD